MKKTSLLICFIGYFFIAHSQDFDITKFGASADSTKTQTEAIQKVIDRAAKNADYPLIPSRLEGQNQLYYAALINAYYVDSFGITEPGTIKKCGQILTRSTRTSRLRT